VENDVRQGLEAHRAVRDRFLSEFALALVQGVDPPEFLPWAVSEIGRVLDVDRLTLFLFEGPAEDGNLAARAAFAAEGVESLKGDVVPYHTSRIAPTVLALRSLAVTDALAEPELASDRELFLRYGTKSILLVPVAIDGVLRGVVNAVTTREQRSWTEDDIAFLESAAHHLSAALKQVELVEALGRERDRLSVLFGLAAAVQRSTTVSNVVEVALAGLRQTLLFPFGAFGILSPDGDEMTGVGGYSDSGGGNFFERLPVAPRNAATANLLLAVLESGEPVLVHDIAADARARGAREHLRVMGVCAVGIFPMRSAGKTVGVLAVGCRDEGRQIEDDDVDTLQSLADFVGVALEQRRTAEAMVRSMREAQALSEASRALLTRTANRDVLLNQILDALVHHFGQENCSLLLYDRGRDALVSFAHRGHWRSEGDFASVIPLSGPGLIPLAAREGAVINVTDVASDPHYVAGWKEARSELVVPLRLDGEIVGVFDLQSSRQAAFGPEDVRMIAAFADRAALALRLADLVRELEQRTAVLEAVSRATQLLNFRLHAPDVLSSVVEETSRAFPNSDGCGAYVADESGQFLSVAASFGVGVMMEKGYAGAPIPVTQLKCAGRAFTENHPVSLEVSGLDELAEWDTPEIRARARSAVDNPEIRHLLAAPIRVGDHRLGVIEVLACRPKAFTKADEQTLALLAEQAAIALRNARLIEELQRSNRLKDDFLANLSHEVRTPLTGIVGWAEVLLDSRGDDPQTRRALEAILGQADTLSRMLGDLIDLSRIDNFGLELRRTRVKMADVIGAALDAVGPSAAKRDVKIECRIDSSLPALEGDAARLQQVVWNLLTNGIKFSPPGSVLRISTHRSLDGGLDLVVEDEGFGIDAAFLPHVFERFRQEETSANRRFGGLGVGLSIVRAIVLAHGGTIVAESPGRERGSRFRVTFPAERVAPSGGWPARPPAPVGAGRAGRP
jgi:GAF domain-containing protein